jgi:hypothetical protein
MAAARLLLLVLLIASRAWGSAEEHSVPKLPQTNATSPKLAARDTFRKLQECESGYYECPASAGGGCCPTGHTCLIDGCREEACDPGYYACSASVGGGCCQTGYTCGLTRCTLGGPPSAGSACGFMLAACSFGVNGCCPLFHKCGATKCESERSPSRSPRPPLPRISASRPSAEKAEEQVGLGLPIGLMLAIFALAAALWSARDRLPCCKQNDSPSSPQVAPLTVRGRAGV